MNAPANVERQASDEPYVIRKGASFYKPNFAGYTNHIEAAGIYSKEQALAVAEDRRSYAGATPPHEVSAQPLSDYTPVIEEASRLLAEKRAALGMTPLVTLAEANDARTDDDVAQIANRHHLDAFWFNGGLHDPNSYVVMAHKDRGALLQRLRALRTGEKAAPNEFAHVLKARADASWLTSTMTIPKAAYDWLMGEGVDEHNCTLDEVCEISAEPARRIRNTLRRMCGR